MARYDRNYDYGMRGRHQTIRPDPRHLYTRYNLSYDAASPERAYYRARLSNRITARYNRDYVIDDGRSRYDVNYNMYTGDRMQRMGDERYYRRPYFTDGGTRTLRGSSVPTGYDYPDYGPAYGGRYPDEL